MHAAKAISRARLNLPNAKSHATQAESATAGEDRRRPPPLRHQGLREVVRLDLRHLLELHAARWTLPRPSPTGAPPVTAYSVPCLLCGTPVHTMTARRQARLCGGDKCRGKEADRGNR